MAPWRACGYVRARGRGHEARLLLISVRMMRSMIFIVYECLVSHTLRDSIHFGWGFAPHPTRRGEAHVRIVIQDGI